MKLLITNKALSKYNLTLRDVGTILYYMHESGKDIDSTTTQKLISQNWLNKDANGIISFNKNREKDMCAWNTSTEDKPGYERFESLALKMMEIFPKGSKCAGHPWRSNKLTVTQKLATLCFRFNIDLDEAAVVAATKRYVESFKGDYTYMQCLNYFILKRDNFKMEDSSALLSYIEQGDSQEVPKYDSGEII